jgi:hypothetical protein
MQWDSNQTIGGPNQDDAYASHLVLTINHIVTRENANKQTSKSLGKMLLGLLVTVGSARIRPGEVDNGNLEEGVAAVLETGKGVVPSHKRSQEPKEACSLLKSDLSSVVTQIVGVVLSREQQKADVEEEEEQEECNSGTESADEEQSRKDKPTGQEETHDRASVTLIRSISTEDVPSGSLQETVGDPKTSVR